MTKYPDWTPKKAIALYEGTDECEDGWIKSISDIRPEINELLWKLLTDDQMRSAWKSLERLENETGFYKRWLSKGIDKVYVLRIEEHLCPYKNFMRGTVIARMGPKGLQAKTKKQRADRILEIKHTARRLSALIQYTGLDNIVAHKRFQELRGNRLSVNDEEMNDILASPALSVILSEVASEAEKYAEPALLSRPNSEDAARVYFVRHLTDIFRKTYSRPMRNVVLNATIVAFDDCNLTERQIIRIAP